MLALSSKAAIAAQPQQAARPAARSAARVQTVAFFGKKAEPKVEEKKGFSFPSFGDKKAAAPKAKKAAPKAKKALLSSLPGYEDENGNVTQYGGKPVSFLSGGRDGDFRFSASGGMYDKMTKNVRFTDVKGK